MRVRRMPPLTHEREKGWTMTIVEGTRRVTGGVDTHLDVHVAAVLDDIGGLLGVERFESLSPPATTSCSVGWVCSVRSCVSVWRALAHTVPVWPAMCARGCRG